MALTQASHMPLLLKSPLSGFSSIQKDQWKDTPWLAGRQAEAHTTEGPMGRLLARTFLASYGEFVPVPLSILDSLRSFLGPSL